MPGSTPAQAAPANTVVLVRTPNKAPGRWRAAEERTRDELRVMGIGVVEIECPEDRPEIERALAEHAAKVAVRVEREGDIGGAEIWWVEATSGDVKAARIEGLGLQVGGGRPDEFQKTVQREAGLYAKIIREANIRLTP